MDSIGQLGVHGVKRVAVGDEVRRDPKRGQQNRQGERVPSDELPA